MHQSWASGSTTFTNFLAPATRARGRTVNIELAAPVVGTQAVAAAVDPVYWIKPRPSAKGAVFIKPGGKRLAFGASERACCRAPRHPVRSCRYLRRVAPEERSRRPLAPPLPSRRDAPPAQPDHRHPETRIGRPSRTPRGAATDESTKDVQTLHWMISDIGVDATGGLDGCWLRQAGGYSSTNRCRDILTGGRGRCWSEEDPPTQPAAEGTRKGRCSLGVDNQ